MVIKYCSFGTKTNRPVDQNWKSGNRYIDIQRPIYLSISRFSIYKYHLSLSLSIDRDRDISILIDRVIWMTKWHCRAGGKRVFQKKRTFQYGCWVNQTSTWKKFLISISPHTQQSNSLGLYIYMWNIKHQSFHKKMKISSWPKVGKKLK